MTAPNRPISQSSRASIPDRWTRWLIAAVPVGLGGVILVAEAMNGNLTSGLVWFGVIAAFGALLAFGGRFEAIRQARGDDEDERDAAIATRAMALTGTVFVILLTGAIVFEAVRGDDLSPYRQLMAVGGTTFVVAMLVLHRRS
jgi:drug/metabolite transporter (DMT)-like permease